MDAKREDNTELKIKETAEIAKQKLALASQTQVATEKEAEFQRDLKRSRLEEEYEERAARKASAAAAAAAFKTQQDMMNETHANLKRQREKEEKASEPAEIQRLLDGGAVNLGQ